MSEQKNKYILKIYDIPLIEFTTSKNHFGELQTEILDMDASLTHLFPMLLIQHADRDTLKLWLESRTIPKNRKFVNEILSVAGLKLGDTMGIMDICKGLSVNDSYWIDQAGNEQKFEDVNLYENELDEALALVAYTGINTEQKRKVGLSTEWTMSGQFPKAWRRIDEKLVLYKAGSQGFANAGMEPYSEYFASQLAEHLEINAVSYDLDQWKGKLASTCDLLNTKDVALVPFWEVAGQSRFPGNLAAASVISEKSLAHLRNMMIFDALICNIDRHGSNYGWLRENKSGKIMGFAPLYDHNFSLFSRDMEYDYDHWPERADAVMMPKTSDLTFKEECALIMGEEQHQLLRKTIDFQFENHPVYPVSQKRLDALNRYISQRCRQLLQIPVVDEKKLKKEIENSLKNIKEPIPAMSILE